jgi:squalene-associated FAD-dependent desaturase
LPQDTELIVFEHSIAERQNKVRLRNSNSVVNMADMGKMGTAAYRCIGSLQEILGTKPRQNRPNAIAGPRIARIERMEYLRPRRFCEKMIDQPAQNHSTLAIVGGGLAGMAAAAAACQRGWRVELFERAPKLGGRAGSFLDPVAGEVIDYCQHVGMGCCTELLDFVGRVGVADCFERTRTLHFIGPTGRQHDFTPCRCLPAPLHLLPGFLKLSYLSWGERWGIARTLAKLVPLDNTTSGDIGSWLRSQNQSENAIERFWSVVLTGALGETVDRASLTAAQKVFRDGFWNVRGACDLLLPKLPLVEIFHDRAGRWLAEHGVDIHCGASNTVRRIETDGRRARSLVLADGTHRTFDACIVAVAWRQWPRLVASGQWSVVSGTQQLESAAITAVHLWFDRPIAELPHAVLVGRLGQWLFTKLRDGGQQYCQVVISASHRIARRTCDAWIADIRRELETLWPAARQAKLLHARAVTQSAAVFSVTPESDRFRPPPQTPLENLFLAGDWTATGWPATMEGAVRSGRRAAELL